ncbi:hypothetical protein [Pontibacter rugosus]
MPASPGLCQALIERSGQAFFAYDTGTEAFTYLSLTFKAIFRIREGGSDNLLALVHPEDRHHVAEKLTALLEGRLSTPWSFVSGTRARRSSGCA